MLLDFVVIVFYVCILMGGLLGSFVLVKFIDLGVIVVRVVVECVGISGDVVDCIYMGCVLFVGLG